MKYLGSVANKKDITRKEYVDEQLENKLGKTETAAAAKKIDVKAIARSSSANLNNYTTDGIYSWSAGTTSMMNEPTGETGSGIMFVTVNKNNPNYLTQEIHYLYNSAVTRIYKRINYNDTWTAWDRIVTENQGYIPDYAGTLEAIPIENNADLNEYTDQGFYVSGTNSAVANYTNCPTTSAFSMFVYWSYNNSATATQEIHVYSTNDPRMFIRTLYSGAWGAWKAVAFTDDNLGEGEFLPLTGGTVTGTLRTVGSLRNVSSGSQVSGFFKYPGTTGDVANEIFSFHETKDDANILKNPRSIIGHLSSGVTPTYIFLAVLDPESDKSPWDQSQGLVIGKTFLRWKGKDVATKDELVVMTGATTSVEGKKGLVPAPSAGAATRYLRSDGTWQVPPNTTYTLSSFGITATAAEINKLDGITATVTELNYTDGVTSNIQTQLNAKAALASPTFTGTPKAPTAAAGTNTTQIATTAYVKTEINNVLAAAGALIYKGTIGTDGTITALPASHTVGDTYVVSTAGNYAGETCEIGDMIICVTTRTTANNADWNIVQTNINGAVTGPASAVTNRVATFNGTTGKVIKDSGFTIASSVPANAKFTDTTYTLSSFGITATATELNRLDGITATTAELNYTDGVTSNIQTQLNEKAASSHNHSAANITSGTLPIARGGTGSTTAAGALANLGLTATADEINKLDGMTATKTELNYLDGVTSAIQTQLNNKLPLAGGTITGNVVVNEGLKTIYFMGDSGTYTGTRYYTASTGGSARLFFGVYPTQSDANSGTNGLFNMGVLTSGSNLTYIYLNPLDADYEGNAYDDDIGLTIANNYLRWKGNDIVTEDQLSGYVTTTGTAASATKLTTARTIRTNLASTTAASFNGTANIAPGVTGTLPVANGGTGATTAAGVLTNLGITATATELNKLDGVTTTTAEFNYVHGVTSNIQTQINSANTAINNKVQGMTQSQYDALSTKASGVLYCIYEE